MQRVSRGKEDRIEDNWIRVERRMPWRLEKIAREERRRNRRSVVRYARLWIEEKWWR